MSMLNANVKCQYTSVPSQDDLGQGTACSGAALPHACSGSRLPLKLSLSLSMHEPMLSLSLSMHEPMLSLSMLFLDPNHPD